MSAEEVSRMNLNPARDQGCPPEEAWFAICGGQIDEIEAQRLLSHAADCGTCGPRLREAAVNWVQEASQEEKDFVANLRSSSEVWQKKLALRLQRESRSEPQRRGRIGQFFWPVAAAAAAAAVLALIWVYRQNHSADALLARAYDQQRLTELRIPGGKPVPLFSPPRGSGPKQESPELLEVRLLAERGLRANPTNAYWHQVLGRIDVVEMEPESALAELQLAESIAPNLPRIQFDLGTAYYELGERTGDSSNYGYAAERFSRYLESVKNRDPVALYNRALCWEKIGVRDLARKDLTAAIELERNSEWREAMKQALQALDDFNAPGPQSKWSIPSEKPDDYEARLSQALEYRLTAPWPSASEQLHPVARMSEEHRDFWLSDWIAASGHRRSPLGDSALSAAIRENLAGNSSRGLQDAKLAQSSYQGTGNIPGILRAETEQVYAMRRMGRPQECLQELAEISSNKLLSRYSWLSADLALEDAACLFQVGRFDEAQKETQTALEIARTARLTLLALRARGFNADFLTSQGLAEDGWRMNVLGLSESSTAPAMRRYQFLSDLTLDASMLGLSRAAAYLATQAASIADQTSNVQIAAYAWELLAQDQLAIRRIEDARQSFEQADQKLAQLGENQATPTYRADWAADRAELQVAEGQGQQGLLAMDQALPAIDQTHSLLIRLNYWARRAQIESRMGKTDNALSSARNAVACAEAAMGQLKSPEERRAWQYNSESAYLVLVDSLIKINRPAEALNQWLSFRSAPEAMVGRLISLGSAEQPSPVSVLSTYPHSEALIYVRLTQRYVVFVVRQGNISALVLNSDPDLLDQMVRTFTILCADPKSSISELEALGRKLDSILLTPAVLSKGSEELRIDVPPSLEGLPFNALVLPDGSYRGSSLRVVYLPEWWSVRPPPHPQKITNSSHLLVVDSGVGLSSDRSIPIVYDESPQLAQMFAGGDLISRPGNVQTVLLRLPSANLFHFTGHATSEGSSAQLSLGGPEGQDPVLLTPTSLRGIVLPHCQLAFLAACTTFGQEPRRIEEPFALPSAFLKAGVVDVVATRWDVDSLASRTLALAFYRALLEGKSPASALKSAEDAVRTTPNYQHPYYWASFCLIEQ